MSNKVTEPLWIRRAAEDRIYYELNREHFLVQSLFESGSKKMLSKITDLLSAIEGKFPIEQFYNDYASNSEIMERPTIDDETMWRFALMTVKSLREAGLDDKEILKRVSGMDPFVGQGELLDKAIEKKETPEHA